MSINEINAEAKESLRKYFKNSQDVKHENEARKEFEDCLIEEKQVQVIEKESEVEKYLKTIDPMALSPLDALSTLIELKKLVK